MQELVICYLVRLFGAFIRLLPQGAALYIGRVIGSATYHFNRRLRRRANANLKMAFADTKSPQEIARITKEVFQNYGQNFIDLYRMPLVNKDVFSQLVNVDGKEHVANSLDQGNGVIFLAMHFGSWEMASLSCAMLGYPYKMMVKLQQKYEKLDALLNSYRAKGGYEILPRGLGTRDFLKSLKNNEVVGLVADQGGKDGVLVPFFGKNASMSVGAIRMGLKGVPICMSVIYRHKGHHHMVIEPPLQVINTGNMDTDIKANLKVVCQWMESYIKKHPAEYTWFYKIWKYTDQARILILNDGKIGHLRQSQATAKVLNDLLTERNKTSCTEVVDVEFKSAWAERLFNAIAAIAPKRMFEMRMHRLKWFLTPDSYQRLISKKADYFISTGSSLSGLTHVMSQDFLGYAIALLKPSIQPLKRYNIVLLPEHDMTDKEKARPNIFVTKGALNLIDKPYLDEKKEALLRRYTHLQNKFRLKVGVLIGGAAKHVYVSDDQVRILCHQLKDAARNLNAEILVTTSRRTPPSAVRILVNALKDSPQCILFIDPNNDDVPEAVGGILGLSDIIVVSGDSISMVSEAASSGKQVICFTPERKNPFNQKMTKHEHFIEGLNKEGYILSSTVKSVGSSIFSIAKQKLQTRKLDNRQNVYNALLHVV